MLWFRSSGSGALWLGSGVIKGNFKTDFASVFALARKALPNVTLATTGDDDTFQINPCFSNEIGSFVVGKDRDFQLVVVGRIVDGESQLLVPGRWLASFPSGCWCARQPS